MKKETAITFVEKLNANMELFSRILQENLGISGNLFITTCDNRAHTETNVFIEEDEDTTRQLTATPLLRQMFKKAGLGIRCFYNEKKDTGTFMVNIYYDHNFGGGSNGTSIMQFEIEFTSQKTRVFKDR